MNSSEFTFESAFPSSGGEEGSPGEPFGPVAVSSPSHDSLHKESEQEEETKENVANSPPAPSQSHSPSMATSSKSESNHPLEGAPSVSSFTQNNSVPSHHAPPENEPIITRASPQLGATANSTSTNPVLKKGNKKGSKSGHRVNWDKNTGGTIHSNPLYETAQNMKKRLVTTIRTLRGQEPEEETDGEDAEVRSLSIDSYYIQPTNEEEESAEKLIQATNCFIATALTACTILAIIIVWLIIEARRKCDFFLAVFTLSWPDSSFLDCDSLPDSSDPDVCVGFREQEVLRLNSMACSGFRCDQSRCVPKNWVCDGFIDCQDQTDERNCSYCSYDEFHCGSEVCIRKEDICDGIKDCPDGRDERQCLRLHSKMGSYGEGRLEAFSAVSNSWKAVCGENWDPSYMSHRACRTLGYKKANETRVQQEAHPRTGGGREGTKGFYRKRGNRGCEQQHLTIRLKCSHFECGKAATSYEPSSRIVGGIESFPGSWPWLVGLHGGKDEVFFCGGILISEHWVLSAAHCVGNQTDLTGWSVHLGLTRRTASPVFVRRRNVSAIVKHHDFNSIHMYGNDIALLRLSEPVNFDEFLRPACLPPKNLTLDPDTRCTVVGWGKPSHDEQTDYMNVIHEVQVPIVRHSVCSTWYSMQDIPIGETMLCAGYPEGEKDACQGDSGGPLLCKSDKTHAWFVAGIVSWGINCAQPNLPGIYTKVSIYRDWIKNMTSLYGYPIDLP